MTLLDNSGLELFCVIIFVENFVYLVLKYRVRNYVKPFIFITTCFESWIVSLEIITRV